jgi:hypothetical protein
VLPAPGEVRYRRAVPSRDSKRAAARIDRGKASAPPVAPAVPPAQDPDPEPAVDPAAPAAQPVAQAEPLQPAAQQQASPPTEP